VQTILTVSKPNAFNHVHQVQRKLKLTGGVVEDKLESMTQRDVQVMGLSPSEAAATLNLLKHVPAQAVEKLRRAAAKHGMWRGPVSHAGLACPALRIGYKPTCDDANYAAELTNTPATVNAMVDRILDDWVQAQVGLRKTTGPDLVLHYQRICSVHETWVCFV
jgi:hypothetical protein